MKITGIAKIYCLQIDPATEKIEFDGFSFSSDPMEADKFICEQDDPSMLIEIGRMGLSSIGYAESRALWYDFVPVIEGWETRQILSILATTQNNHLAAVLHSLWFAKDNSVFCKDIYVRATDFADVAMNTRAPMISNSSGQYEKETYNLDELSHSFKIYSIIKPYFLIDSDAPTPPEPSTPVISPFNYVPYDEKQNIIVKALLFLYRAREASFLPHKISFYIVVLESLFSTTHYHIKKNLPKTVASYLNGTIAEFDQVTNDVINGYDIRTEYLHGSFLTGDRSDLIKLRQISNSLDEILRKCLNKALLNDLENFLLDNDERKAWLNGIVTFRKAVGTSNQSHPQK
ncbi:MAG: hypothetical protein EOO90_21675 [Pedobacter sp.]|nr:MAG: hypothetical protein EOO90_21675 [Pedobacter sp.]